MAKSRFGGWWRLWISASAIWLCLVGVLAVDLLQRTPYCQGDQQNTIELERCASDYRAHTGLALAAMGLTPPIASLGLGLLACWIIGGFRSSRS